MYTVYSIMNTDLASLYLLSKSLTNTSFHVSLLSFVLSRGPDSEFLKKILRVASMQERMDLPAKAQEENDLLEVRKYHLILFSL